MKRSLLKPKSNCACSLEFRCVHILPRERKDLKPIKFEIPFDLPAETLEFYISGIEQFNEQPKQVCWNASAHTHQRLTAQFPPPFCSSSLILSFFPVSLLAVVFVLVVLCTGYVNIIIKR